MRYLAIDYGGRRTGLAICDPTEVIASPHSIIEGHGGLIPRIIEIVRQESVDAIVVGLPLNMDGTEGFQAKEVRCFALALEKSVRVPILFQDERLSSFGARERLAGVAMSRGRKRKRLDAIAAAEILEAFLEGRRQVNEIGDP